MSITYTNRKGRTYYLCQGVTKTGKPRYYFAREPRDTVLEELPGGYEIRLGRCRLVIRLRHHIDLLVRVFFPTITPPGFDPGRGYETKRKNPVAYQTRYATSDATFVRPSFLALLFFLISAFSTKSSAVILGRTTLLHGPGSMS